MSATRACHPSTGSSAPTPGAKCPPQALLVTTMERLDQIPHRATCSHLAPRFQPRPVVLLLQRGDASLPVVSHSDPPTRACCDQGATQVPRAPNNSRHGAAFLPRRPVD